MKIKTLAIAAGISAPLLLSGLGSAGFVGIKVTAKDNPFDLLVFNVYAIFDRPGQDHMLSVAGTPQSPLIISVVGGTFYQHLFGSDKAPFSALVAAFPSLAYDTFVIIGVKMVGAGGQPVDALVLSPGWPGFSPSVLTTTSESWSITPADAQGDPFDAVNSFPGNGQILIGQFSTHDSFNICGTMLLGYISNGVAGQAVVSFIFGGCPLFCQFDADCDDGDPCNGEEVCDALTCLVSPPVPDCNANGVLDSCDIANGTSTDANDNGIPDSCECPWDCGDNDGTVGIVDFLALLAQWGGPGSCDIDGGGVGITDFLELLANWGPCP